MRKPRLLKPRKMIYGFMHEMVEPILRGSKQHTIRPERENPTRVGDIMIGVTDKRTTNQKPFFSSPIVQIRKIEIDPIKWTVKIDGEYLAPAKIQILAQGDGFPGMQEFFKFFERYSEEKRKNLRLIFWKTRKETDEFKDLLHGDDQPAKPTE